MRGNTVSTALDALGRGARGALLGLVLLLVNPTACDDAPGCAGGCGGCTNRQAIRDFEYTGPTCLWAAPNDCTWTSIEFRNGCTAPVVFDGGEISAGSGYDYRQPIRRPDGGWDLCTAGHDCPGTPASNETVELHGTMDGQEVFIRFFVTGEQC